jgi:hypothetical protein
MSQPQGNGLFVCLMVFDAAFNNIAVLLIKPTEMLQ